MAVVVQDPQPVYTVEDFRNSVKQLLPPGEYWQSDEESADLTALIDSIAEELHTTHEETKISVLFTVDNSLFGWKISDYQALLNSLGITAMVFDDVRTPNIIYISIGDASNLQPGFEKLENYLLPHTAAVWVFTGKLNTQSTIRPASYIRLNCIEA